MPSSISVVLIAAIVANPGLATGFEQDRVVPESAATVAPDVGPAPEQSVPLDNDAPLAPLPEFEVEWPDDEDFDGDFEDPIAETDDPPDKDQSVEQADAEQAGAEAAERDRPVENVGVDAAEIGPDAPEEELAEEIDTSEPEQFGRLAGRDIDYDIVLAFGEAKKPSGAQSPDFNDRFNGLSTLGQLDDDPANLAQIRRRARKDRQLLESLFRVYGHYDALIEQRVDRGSGTDHVTIVYDLVPGPLYTLSAIDLRGLEAATADLDLLRSAFGLSVGDPVNSDAIVIARADLIEALSENGYAFASLDEPELVIDHAATAGELIQPVAPGAKYRFGAIRVPENSLLPARHLQRIARFEPGQVYSRSLTEDLRRAMLATGLYSSVTLKPVDAGDQDDGEPVQQVDIAVESVTAPLRTVAGEIGYGTGEGVRVAASWEHRNFFPPEGLLRVRGVAGTQEQLVGAQIRWNNWRERDQILNLEVLASNVDRNAFKARTLRALASIERQTNLIFQKKWTWSAGVEVLASEEEDVVGPAGAVGSRRFYIAALPGYLSYDGSDDLLNPTKGFRLGGRLSPEVSLDQGTNLYSRAQIDASGYYPVSDTVVLAGRVRIGTIFGAGLFEIAPSRRNYAGGGGSVRGYGYQRIGPRDANNDPIGGRGLAEFALEARIKVGNFGIVPFVDGGNIYSATFPDFTGMRYGAGIGVRYYSSFGPLRLDVGTPINPQPGDNPIAIYISLGQAF